MKYSGEIIDIHLHMRGEYNTTMNLIHGMEEIRKTCNLKEIVIQSIPQFDVNSVGQNMVALLLKLYYPVTTHAFGGLEYYCNDDSKSENFEEQAENLMQMGFDGIKMIEAKPFVRKNIGDIGLNDSQYNDFYSFVEKKDIPVLMHVADPETFWSLEAAPDWAKVNGWVYANKPYLSKLQLYHEAEDVFMRFPNIRFCLAHFYFLSNDIETARRIMDRYPNINFDITPGTEMYENFSRRKDEWHDFFTQYSDRILFGTDNGWGIEETMNEKVKYAKYNYDSIRRFLETSDVFSAYGFEIKGIDLDVESLKKIYIENAQNFMGQIKPVDVDHATNHYKKIVECYADSDLSIDQRVIQQMQDVLKLLLTLKNK